MDPCERRLGGGGTVESLFAIGRGKSSTEKRGKKEEGIDPMGKA